MPNRHGFDHFTGVLVDNKETSKDNYDAGKGSVIINLKSSFLDTLSEGEHTLTALFDDGDSVTVKFTVAAKAATVEKKEAKENKAASPITGDSTPLMAAFALMLTSALCAVYFTVKRREER